MEKEFVPYDLALELKQLGFEEPCFGVYVENELFIVSTERPSIQSHSLYQGLAPLYQQAFRWFREKYSLIGIIDYSLKNLWSYRIYINNTNWVNNFKTYEEAELACLKKLIEIVKTK